MTLRGSPSGRDRALQHRHLRAAHPAAGRRAPPLHRGHGQRANLVFVAFARYGGAPGHPLVLFALAITVAEVAVGLALVLLLYRRPRGHVARPGQRGKGMNPSVTLALVTLVAPLDAALVSVVIPPIGHRGAPAAMLAILGSLLATGAAALLLMEDVAGRAIRATVPWMVVQGRGLGEVGVRLDARVHPDARGGVPGGPGGPDVLGRVHAGRVATVLRPLLRATTRSSSSA